MREVEGYRGGTEEEWRRGKMKTYNGKTHFASRV